MNRRGFLKRARDYRRPGRTADTEVIITNRELRELIRSVCETIDSPASVQALRGLVMSRLSINHISFAPLQDATEEWAADHSSRIADTNPNPEEKMLEDEMPQEVERRAAEFIRQLPQGLPKVHDTRERVMKTLWHCYLAPQKMTRVELARRLDVSDSLISTYTTKIDRELRGMKMGLEEARMFEGSLRRIVQHQAIDGIDNYSPSQGEPAPSPPPLQA